MQQKLVKFGAAALCALGLAACGSAPYDDGRYVERGYYGNGAYTEYGRVVGIETVGTNGDGHTSGAGAVIGGVVGGVLGHQVGSGRGNTAATIGGAVAGAAVGNEIERRREDRVAYRVDVRLDNGALRSATTDAIGDLRVGDRVRIENGRVSRY